MSTNKTPNLQMHKWVSTDYFKREEIVENFDILDTQLSSKANKTYVDQKITAVASGAPKGVYSTLSTLQTAFPTGNSNIYLVTSDGKWYYWNGTTWTAGGVYQSTGIPAGSIKPELTTFFKQGKNLFNKNSVTPGYFVNNASGALVSDVNFNASDFIAILPNTSYYKNNTYAFALYDSNKAYISGGTTTGINTPTNGAFIRISATNSTLSSTQLELGTVQTTYEDYYNLIPKDIVEKPSITVTDVPPLPINNLSFAKLGTNLFNKTSVNSDKYVNNTNGVLVSSTGFVASDYIPIKSSTAYTFKYIRHFAFYANDKTFISGENIMGQVTRTPPTSAAFVRISWYPPSDSVSLDTQQVNEGGSLLPYEPYGLKIPSDYLDVSPVSVKVILPPKIEAIVGKEINIYFQNILNVKQGDIQIDVICTIGKQEERRWTCIPSTAGTFTLTIRAYKDFRLITESSTSIVVKDANVGTTTKKMMIIGDSTVNAGGATQRLLDLFATDSMKLTLYGTRGTSPNSHEGRGGWTAANYRTNLIYSGDNKVNPFYSASTNDFNFTSYMTTQGYPVLDYVGICLGINDTFGFTDDMNANIGINSIIINFDAIINSIKSYNNSVKVGIFVTIPPNESQDAFGLAYNCDQTQWRYKRNNALWIDKLINYYKGKEAQGIYLIPVNNNIDAKNNIGDGVHPTSAGYNQNGDSIYYWLKGFES